MEKTKTIGSLPSEVKLFYCSDNTLVESQHEITGNDLGSPISPSLIHVLHQTPHKPYAILKASVVGGQDPINENPHCRRRWGIFTTSWDFQSCEYPSKKTIEVYPTVAGDGVSATNDGEEYDVYFGLIDELGEVEDCVRYLNRNDPDFGAVCRGAEECELGMEYRDDGGSLYDVAAAAGFFPDTYGFLDEDEAEPARPTYILDVRDIWDYVLDVTAANDTPNEEEFPEEGEAIPARGTEPSLDDLLN